jgi:acyl-CoA synthetase (AMP-forming)/AMP-acid ligase II
MSLFGRFAELARVRPNRTAVGNETDARTFGELLEDARRVGDLVGSGRHRAVVMIALPSGPQFTATQLGCLATGAIVAPVPVKLTPHEAEAYLGLVQPDLVVVPSIATAAPLLEALREPTTVLALEPGEVGALHRLLVWRDVTGAKLQPLATRDHGLPVATRQIQFTSGSTGAPKGILISEPNLIAALEASTRHLQWFCDRDVFCPVPQFHAMGNAVVLEHLSHGSPVHLANRFLPGENLARMQKFACAGLLASPNYYKLMLKLRVLRPDAVPQLESMTLGTASVDQALVDEIRAAFPSTRLHIRYGLSEAVGPLTRLDLEAGQRLAAPGLIGPPVDGVEFDTLPGSGAEPAELRVRHGTCAIGQLLARGEWQPLVDARGFLSTGDLACLDDHGRLHLRGRLSAFIKYNGYRVNAFEIEAVLRAIDGVQEAVVVGAPNELTGERIVACLEPSPGKSVPARDALFVACQRELSGYKIPQEFRALDALPRTPAGKPDRKAVRVLVGG